MRWFEYPIAVPYGNSQYDVLLGGSHDLTVRTPLGTPVDCLLSGTVTEDPTSPTWGKQVCVELDTPVHGGVKYMAYLHLGYVNPSIKKGSHLKPGDDIGLSGGATYPAFSGSIGLFVNTPEMSSQPQTGIALMRGPSYGIGEGWDAISHDLDPTDIIDKAREEANKPAPDPTPETQPAEEFSLSSPEPSASKHYVPHGWHDDGKELVAPNGHKSVLGFRERALELDLEPDNEPQEDEHGVDHILESDPSSPAGTRQAYRDFLFTWSEKTGVQLTHTGAELKYVTDDRDNLRKVIDQATSQVSQLKAGMPLSDIKDLVQTLSSLSAKLSGMVQ